MSQVAREGDFIETESGLIFDVKGFMHPPGHIIAFLRYYPDTSGSRTRHGLRYRKVYSLKARYDLLREKYPDLLRYDSVFDRTFSEIPIFKIKLYHRPAVYLSHLLERNDLDPVEQDAVSFANLLITEAKVPPNDLGITGSVLVQLHESDSDIDLICYGSAASRRVYSALHTLIKARRGSLAPYDEPGLRKLFSFRRKDTKMSYADFARVEERKILQGTYRGRDYYLRLLKDWSEITEVYGDLIYRPSGRATITAVISDDSENIFTPCRYLTENVKTVSGDIFSIKQIISYRGRFCEQARKGESIMAAGEIELVEGRLGSYYQLVLGNRKQDFLKVI